MWEGTKVLVTGGAGFVGRHLVPQLEERGAQVYIPRSVQWDLEKPKATEGLFRHAEPDVVFHLASHYGGLGITMAEPADIFRRNMLMGLNVLQECAQRDLKLVVCGTACSYPDGFDDPMPESQFWAGQLHGSVEGYGTCKKALEAAQRAYRNQYRLRSIHVILANLYGPHDDFSDYRSHAVAALVKKAFAAKKAGEPMKCWGTGSAIREFLYVKDAATGLRLAAEKYDDDSAPLNIGTGEGTSIRELVKAICDAVPFIGEVQWDDSKPDGQAVKILETSKMKQVLEWEPEHHMLEALRETCRWYKEIVA
jgi:nucleoside-diphosphate-sugar epimerase